MTKINPMAIDLKSGKYRQRIVKSRKKYNRKKEKRVEFSF
jgi:hypothetical protein